jgi:hypothetical protein
MHINIADALINLLTTKKCVTFFFFVLSIGHRSAALGGRNVVRGAVRSRIHDPENGELGMRFSIFRGGGGTGTGWTGWLLTEAMLVREPVQPVPLSSLPRFPAPTHNINATQLNTRQSIPNKNLC